MTLRGEHGRRTAGVRVASTAAAVLALCLLSGCGRQVILGYAHFDEAHRVFRHMSGGIGGRFGGPYDGIDLGWSDVVVAYPSAADVEAPASEPASAFNPPFGWTWSTDDGVRRWIGLVTIPAFASDDCVFVARMALGAGIGLSSHFAGFDVGGSHTTLLVADPSVSRAYRLEYSSNEPAACRLIDIKGE